MRGICRAVGVKLKWLLGFLVQRFEVLPDHLHVQPVRCTQDVMIRRLEVEAGEMASFVQNKANKQWIWLAMDTKSHQIIALHVGGRSRKSAKRLWAKIPRAVPLPLQPDESCGVERALHGAHYPSNWRILSRFSRRTPAGEVGSEELQERTPMAHAGFLGVAASGQPHVMRGPTHGLSQMALDRECAEWFGEKGKR